MNLKVLALCSAAACAFAVAPTHAATPVGAPAATDSVSEVVVTAQKRTEKLNRVPIAISAYTAKLRDNVGINSLQDYAAFTPGLSYSTSTDRVFLRGVGRETNTIGSDPGVATYSDGVYSASTGSVGADTLFAQRTEILRGPQGTLYGRNSIGGAIDVISQRPTDTLQGEVRTTFVNYGVYNVEGAVSGPINDKLKFRLAGLRNDQEEGYYKNLAGGTSEGGKGVSYYAEGQLQADFTPDFNAWLKVFGADARSNPRSVYGGGTNGVGPFDYSAFPAGFLTPGAAFGYNQPGVVASGPAINPGQKNYRDFDTNSPGKAHLSDNYGATLHLDWHVAGIDVKYIGGVQHYRYEATSDLDNTSVSSYQFPLAPGGSICAVLIPGCGPLTVNPSLKFNYLEDKTFWSNELDFSSSRPGPVQWIAGLYEYGETFTQGDHFNNASQPQLLAPANGPANPSGDYVNAGGNLDTTTYAAFGQVDWNITPSLKLTGGVRYTWDHKQGVEHLRELCFGLTACGFSPDQFGTSTPALDLTASVIPPNFSGRGVSGPTTIDPTTGIAYRPLSASWSAATGTAGLEWTPDPTTMAYAKYSRGYKSGGFNEGGISAQPETDPEYIDAFEIGAKKDVNRQLQLNVAGYYYIYNGFQVPLTVNIPGGAQMTNFFNLDKVVSYGAELEAIWQPTSQLQFLLSYSYLNATIQKAQSYVDVVDPAAGNQSVVGQTVPESPRNKIALNGSYRFDFRPGSLTLSASYMWKDATYDSIFNRPYYQAPAYSQTDLRALWSDAKDRYTIILYAKNVFDTKGYDNAFGTLITDTGAIAQSYSYTPPRTFGVELRYKFH